jgi:hypothetical protein
VAGLGAFGQALEDAAREFLITRLAMNGVCVLVEGVQATDSVKLSFTEF